MQDQMTSGAAGQKNKTYALAMTALMAAVTCVLAPMAIPIGPVPISLTNLAIYLSLYLLGWKWGDGPAMWSICSSAWWGVPVFSGFTGGWASWPDPPAATSSLWSHGGAGRTGDRPLPEPGGPVRGGWPRPRRCATPSERRGSASPWTAPCPPPWACVCSPSFRGMWIKMLLAMTFGRCSGSGWSGPGCTGADRSGEGASGPLPKSFLSEKKRLDKRGQGAYNDTNKSMRRKPLRKRSSRCGKPKESPGW